MILMREICTTGGPHNAVFVVWGLGVSSSSCYAIHRKKSPLKPKPGLNGPPVHSFYFPELKSSTNNCGRKVRFANNCP